MKKAKTRKKYRTLRRIIYRIAYKLNQIHYREVWKKIKDFLYLLLLIYVALASIIAMPLIWLLFGY